MVFGMYTYNYIVIARDTIELYLEHCLDIIHKLIDDKENVSIPLMC